MGRGKRLISLLSFLTIIALCFLAVWIPAALSVLEAVMSSFVALITLLMAGDVVQEKAPEVIDAFKTPSS